MSVPEVPTGVIRLLRNGFVGLPSIRLDGDLVYLRPARAGDWQDWAELRQASRAFLAPWEPSWPPDALTRRAFVRRMRRQAAEWREDEAFSFLVFRQEDDRMVGGIGLSNVRRGVAQMATLGYWVGHCYARRGLTTDAARSILDFAFGQLGLHRVEAAFLPYNRPSRGLLEKVGFVYEGTARGYLRIDGVWHDHALYGLLREDWRRP